MNKSTLLLTSLAALGLGALIGQNLVDENLSRESDQSVSNAPNSPSGNSTSDADALLFRFIKPGDIPVTYDQSGNADPAATGENFVGIDGEVKSQEFTIVLKPDEAKEYKALMKQGDAVIFSWHSESGPLYYDFHAHDASFGEDFFTRYAEGNSDSSSGVIVAPYTGQHGWYWHNKSNQPLTIKLEVVGFYARVVKFDLG